MFSLPQWHRLTQTNFPPRPRKTVRHSDITDEIWQHGAQQTRSRWAPPSAQLLPAPHYQVASSDAAAPRCFFPQSACTTKSHFGNSYTLWQPPPSFSATVTHLGTSVFDDSYTLWQPPPPSSTAVRHFRNLHLCFGQSYTLATSSFRRRLRRQLHTKFASRLASGPIFTEGSRRSRKVGISPHA